MACVFSGAFCYLILCPGKRQDSIRKAALSVERQSVPSITEGLKESSSDATIQEKLI